MPAAATVDRPDDDSPLYEARKEIYPQAVQGRFRTIKWAILVVTLGIYYFLPFLRWDRGPNAPDQAVLIDLANRRFYFFFIEIWPQELYYVTGLLVLAALALFLMNAVAGRIWCGYLCPQTVWTDLFYAVERLIEGDRRERIKQGRRGTWDIERVAEKVLKHSIWLLIAWWTGGAWVLYFADAPTLVRELVTFQAPVVAYVWIGILTFTTYALAGFMREQVCLYMCPWPRIQAALTDEHALNVTYRYDRGEPRMSAKKAEAARARASRPATASTATNASMSARPASTSATGSQLGLHPVRPVHRRLRQRHGQDRPADRAHRLRHRHERPASHRPRGAGGAASFGPARSSTSRIDGLVGALMALHARDALHAGRERAA